MCTSGARRKYTFNGRRIIRQVKGLESSYEDVCANSKSRNATKKEKGSKVRKRREEKKSMEELRVEELPKRGQRGRQHQQQFNINPIADSNGGV